MEMNYEKALRILGLSSSFTEEDLKKAYRTEAKKYHPDNYSKASSEEQEKAKYKMQEVNAAYEYIVKYRKNNVRNEEKTRTNNDELDKLKKQMKDKLNSYLKYDENKNYDSLFNDYLVNIKPIVNGIIFNMLGFTSESSIISITNATIKRIKEYYANMKTEFYKKYNIPYSFVTNFNYECSIGEFYDQLLEVKKNYENNVKNRILQETEKYKSYAGYEDLEIVIKDIINKAVNSSNSNIDEVIKNLHEDIKKVFEKHFRIIDIFSSAREYLQKHPDMSNKEYLRILDHLNKLEKEYQGIKLIIFGDLNKFVKEFNDYKNKTEIAGNNELKTYYQTIVVLHSKKLFELNWMINQKEIEKLNNHFLLVMSYYKKIGEGLVPIEDAIKVLSQIKFDDIAKEQELITGVDSKNKEQDKSNIYIKINNLMYVSEQTSFFYLDEADGKKHLFHVKKYGLEMRDEITDEILVRDYISLEDFLNTSEYIGCEAESNFGRYMYILYKNDYGIIYLDGSGYIKVEVSRGINYTLKSETKPQKGKDYRDKQELINDIKIDIEQNYAAYKRYRAEKETTTDNEPLFKRSY